MNAKLTILTTLALAAVPAGAQAKVFCVADPSCADPKPTITDAVKAAAELAGDDEVRVGPGTFTEAFVYPSGGLGRLTISGAGRDRTILESRRALSFVARLDGASIADLSIRALDQGTTGATGGLRLTDGAARRIDVFAEGEDEPIRLENGSVLEDVRVRTTDDDTTGVLALCDGGCSVRRAWIDSTIAIQAAEAAKLDVEDLEAFGGVAATGGATATIRRALIVPGAIPIGVHVSGGTLDLRQATIALRGGPTPTSTGAEVVPASPTGQLRAGVAFTTLRLEGVAIDGFETPIHRRVARFDAREESASSATIVARSSAWDRSIENLRPGAGARDLVGVVDLADRGRRFVNPAEADFRLRADSPLIDAVADPVPADFRDLAGSSIADGDGDGTARADIGAFESAAAASEPAALPPATEPGSGPPLVAPTARAARGDVTRPRLTKVRLVRGRLIATLSEAARLRVVVQRKRGTRFARVGKVVTLRAKRNVNRLALRLPKRAGRYRLVITAVDTAGNRSATKRIALRVR